MTGYQYLLEIDALDGSSDAVTLRYCCAPDYTGGGYTWTPGIVDPGLIRTTLFSGGKTTGASSYSYGEIVLDNTKDITALSGPRDDLRTYQFYGRQARLYMGPPTAEFPGGFTRMYTATIESINSIGSSNQVSLTLRGRQAELDVAFNTSKFLGTNVAPDGTEGDTALKDQLKPVLVGRAHNFSPTLCNSSKLIYAVSVDTGLSVDEMGSGLHLYDSGVELSFAGLKALSALQADAPPPGKYYAAAEGYIRLGSPPAGALTVTGASGGRALTAHPKNLTTDVLTTAGKDDMLDASSFTGYADKHERGLFLGSQATNISTIIDGLVAPLGFWYFNASGLLRFGTVDAAMAAASVYTLDSETNITGITISRSSDTKGGVPAKSVSMTYERNYSPGMSTAASVTAARQEWIKNEWRTASAAADTVHPFSEEMTFETTLTTAPPAILAALKSLHTVKRELVEVETVSTAFLQTVQLLPGQNVTLDLHGRFGYTNKKMLIVGIVINCVKEAVTLTLWG